MIPEAASLILLIGSALFLALTTRGKIVARKKPPKAERKKTLADLLVLADQQLSSLKFEPEEQKREGRNGLRNRRVGNE